MADATVKIVRFHKVGEPEVLQIDELPLPEPGKGEVRLRVAAIGLNRAEVMFRKGKYLFDPVLPSKIGYEAAGIVEAVGAGVDTGLIGKKFSTVPCFNVTQYGVYGEVAIVPDFSLAKYPDKLSAQEATSIWMQYLTAYGALILYAKIKKGDFVLITAASSSVGIAAIEMAKAEGATSIATTRTEAKKAQLIAAGADHVIVTDTEDLATRVKEITGGNGCGVIFDPIGGQILEQLATVASYRGVIYEYGALAPEPTPYPLFTALSKGLTIQAYTLFEVVSDPAIRAVAEKYVFDNIEAGHFKPLVDKTFTLTQIVDAHRYMESNQQIGKIVVTV